MAGTGRTAVAAWAATLAASCALLPLVQVGDWLLQAGLLLGLVTAAGVVARRLRVPTALAASMQLLLAVVLLTVATVPQHAVGGFLPGPLAWYEFGVLFGVGAEDVGTYSSPAPLTDGIALLLLTAVLGIGLLVDLLAVSLRSAAAAGLPLLALYSAASGISPEGASWPYFAVAAAGFLLLLLSESRHRLASWGRYLPVPGTRGAGSPAVAGGDAGRRAARPPRMRTGRRVGAVAVGAAVVAPLVLPSLGEGVLDPAAHGGGRGGEEGQAISVDPVVALQDQLNQPENRTVLTYETDSDSPSDLYLRLVALDDFTGEEWLATGEVSEEVPPAPWPVLGLDPEVETTEATTTITADGAYAQRSLPVPVPAVDVTASGTWTYDVLSRTLRSPNRSARTAGRTWEVRHLLVEPDRHQLEQAPEPDSELIREHFTAVPDELPAVVHETATRVTEDADSAHEQAVALQDWFLREGGFQYDTDVASGSGPDAVARFLEDREGFCVHFAFTMAAMARTLDIPAQVSVGFTPGTRQADGTFEVGLHNAHAWPELYFEGVGWTRFEPTPGQGTTPSYTRPERDADGADAATEPDGAAQEEADSEESAQERPEEDGDTSDCDPRLPPEECVDLLGESAGEDGSGAVAWPVVAGGAAVVVAALAVTPLLWRTWLRRRRLAPGAGVLAAWAELTDSAWDHGMPPDPAETPRQVAARLVGTGDLGEDPAAVAAVERLATAVERALYAPPTPGVGGGVASGVGDGAVRGTGRPVAEGADAGQPAEDVRTVLAGLRATAPSGAARLRARMAPGSAVRVIRGVAARRDRFTEKATVTVRRLAVPPWRRGRRSRNVPGTHLSGR